MNPYIKNCRTGFHDDILNRTSHYLKLLTTKSGIVNRHQKDYLFLLKQNQSKEKDQARNTANLRLMNSLIDIQRRCSTYAAQSERHLQKKKMSMKSQYQQRQQRLSLSKDNFRIYQKLTGIESEISCDKIRKFDEDITRYSKLIKHPHHEITQMDDRLFQTYRHELIKTKLSPQKYRILTEAIEEKRIEEQVKPSLKIKKRRLRVRKARKEGHSPQEHASQHTNPQFFNND